MNIYISILKLFYLSILKFRYKWDFKNCKSPIYAVKDDNAKCEDHYFKRIKSNEGEEYIILSQKFGDIRSNIKTFESKLINYKIATAIVTGMAAHLGEDINKDNRDLIDSHLKVISFIFLIKIITLYFFSLVKRFSFKHALIL